VSSVSAQTIVRLAGYQPDNSAFLSHQFSTSYQPPASQQYFSLTINQPQPPVTRQPNEAHEPATFILVLSLLGSERAGAAIQATKEEPGPGSRSLRTQ
jgi:hypothetical protein